jgi:hypothetical protein
MTGDRCDANRHMARTCILAAAQGLTLLIACAPLHHVVAADGDQPGHAVSATKTGKERLTDKASDEQRVDDCKVAPARRTRSRPTNCAGAGG